MFRLIILSLFLLTPFYSQAQLEASANIELGAPYLRNDFNEKLYYGQFTVGMRLGISYKPQNTQFFPTLHYAFGQTKLPLKQLDGRNVAFKRFNYQNLMLSGNLVFNHEERNQLYLYTGIGLVALNDKGTNIYGPDRNKMEVRIDSTANLEKRYPAMNLGFEYVMGANDYNNPIYISIGLVVQYWYMYPSPTRNYYRLELQDATSTTYPETYLYGHVFVPFFYMSLHYMLNRETLSFRRR